MKSKRVKTKQRKKTCIYIFNWQFLFRVLRDVLFSLDSRASLHPQGSNNLLRRDIMHVVVEVLRHVKFHLLDFSLSFASQNIESLRPVGDRCDASKCAMRNAKYLEDIWCFNDSNKVCMFACFTFQVYLKKLINFARKTVLSQLLIGF